MSGTALSQSSAMPAEPHWLKAERYLGQRSVKAQQCSGQSSVKAQQCSGQSSVKAHVRDRALSKLSNARDRAQSKLSNARDRAQSKLSNVRGTALLKGEPCPYQNGFPQKNAFRKSIENGRFRKCSYSKGANFKEQFLPGDKRFLPTMYPKLKGIRETWGRLCRVKLRERNQLIIWMERVCVSIK